MNYFLDTINPFAPDFFDRVQTWLSHRCVRPTALIASAYRQTLGKRTTLVAVTGSFGKTTTTNAVLRVLGRPRAERIAYNSYSRLYLELLRQTGSHSLGAIEIGIGQPNQMFRYARTIAPNVAIVTAIGLEHEGYFPDGITGIRNEKAELVRSLPSDGVAILNHDDENVMWMADQTQARVVTFGKHPDADVRLIDIQIDRENSTLIRLEAFGEKHEVQTQLLGQPAIVPVLSAIAAAHAVEIEISTAIERLNNLSAMPRRLEPHALPNGTTAVLDDCKGTPQTVYLSLDTLANIPAKRRWAVLGNIPKTTPEPKEPVYRAMGRRAAEVCDGVCLIHLSDQAFESYQQGLLEGGLNKTNIYRAENVQVAANILNEQLESGDVVLLKANSRERLSRIILSLFNKNVSCRLTECERKKPLGSCEHCPHYDVTIKASAA